MSCATLVSYFYFFIETQPSYEFMGYRKMCAHARARVCVCVCVVKSSVLIALNIHHTFPRQQLIPFCLLF